MWVVPMTGSPPIPTAVEKPMSRSSYIIWYVSVPDLETSPIRPAEVMSAGMMPALDRPGVIRPGQFGPISRVVPERWARAKKAAVSCTGMPSVITTTSGTAASMLSSTAARAKRGGTKTTDTSAPVSFTASATVPKTGMPSTCSPALRGLTPPTSLLPAATIRRVCFMPSEPVMPCTMIRDDPVRKMDTADRLLSPCPQAPRRVARRRPSCPPARPGAAPPR